MAACVEAALEVAAWVEAALEVATLDVAACVEGSWVILDLDCSVIFVVGFSVVFVVVDFAVVVIFVAVDFNVVEVNIRLIVVTWSVAFVSAVIQIIIVFKIK